jgi:hypothetical protein
VVAEEFKVFMGDTGGDIVNITKEVCDSSSAIVAGIAIV